MRSLVVEDSIVEELTEAEQESFKYLYKAWEEYKKKKSKNFSILITDKYPADPEKYSLIYIISNDNSIVETNNIRRVEGDNAKSDAFQLAARDFKNRHKSVLLYLGKFPGYGFDVDGGSILARQLINSLKIRCDLTVCFIRKNKEIFEDSDVCEVRYVEYKDPWNNKFIRRLENLDTNYEALQDYVKFDIIIAGHISKFYGMAKCGTDFWKKTIIFPMFCTSSYVRAGEVVPLEYTKQEQIVIDNVSQIITPSNEEKEDLIRDYKCKGEKISVINRGIMPYIHYSKRTLKTSRIRMVCIGTIKTQKNTKAAIELLKILRKYNLECELHLVATIQDRKYYEEFCKMIKNENLDDLVVFHISIPQTQLAELLNDMDINISMSSWETFGRGIFEGASAGLPTFVFDVLETVKSLSGNNKGFYFASSVGDMAKAILAAVSDKEKYTGMSEELSAISHDFSYKNEQNRLMEKIFMISEEEIATNTKVELWN